MSRPQSVETELRHAKSRLKLYLKELSEAKVNLTILRGRVTKAEQEAAEWRKRFDELLFRREKQP